MLHAYNQRFTRLLAHLFAQKTYIGTHTHKFPNGNTQMAYEAIRFSRCCQFYDSAVPYIIQTHIITSIMPPSTYIYVLLYIVCIPIPSVWRAEILSRTTNCDAGHWHVTLYSLSSYDDSGDESCARAFIEQIVGHMLHANIWLGIVVGSMEWSGWRRQDYVCARVQRWMNCNTHPNDYTVCVHRSLRVCMWVRLLLVLSLLFM